MTDLQHLRDAALAAMRVPIVESAQFAVSSWTLSDPPRTQIVMQVVWRDDAGRAMFVAPGVGDSEEDALREVVKFVDDCVVRFGSIRALVDADQAAYDCFRGKRKKVA